MKKIILAIIGSLSIGVCSASTSNIQQIRTNMISAMLSVASSDTAIHKRIYQNGQQLRVRRMMIRSGVMVVVDTPAGASGRTVVANPTTLEDLPGHAGFQRGLRTNIERVLDDAPGFGRPA